MKLFLVMMCVVSILPAQDNCTCILRVAKFPVGTLATRHPIFEKTVPSAPGGFKQELTRPSEQDDPADGRVNEIRAPMANGKW
jgi:hypothetical protein